MLGNSFSNSSTLYLQYSTFLLDIHIEVSQLFQLLPLQGFSHGSFFKVFDEPALIDYDP
jgi:hypothetical protein